MDTRLHVLGEKHNAVIVMIHGTGMSWDMLMDSAKILKEKYCVVLVSVPGHDPNTTEEFTSVEQIADEIETGLIEMGRSSVDLLYGLTHAGKMSLNCWLRTVFIALWHLKKARKRGIIGMKNRRTF